MKRLPGDPISCLLKCFGSFFMDFIYSQSLQCKNLTITLPLSFLVQWHASMSHGDTLQPIFLNMVRALSSDSILWILSGMPTTSRNSLLEYWSFVQNYLSISTNLFDDNKLACFTTFFSASSWLNFWLNLCISLRMWLFADSTFLWGYSRIWMSSILSNLPNTSSVQINIMN